MLAAMDRGEITVTLDLRVEHGVVSGQASDRAGAAREFAGWLDLAGAIDALLRRDAAPGSSDPRFTTPEVRSHAFA
jgi:hypothetical protein